MTAASNSQLSTLNRFSRQRLPAGAVHRNISALVLDIRDDGPAFARGTPAPMTVPVKAGAAPEVNPDTAQPLPAAGDRKAASPRRGAFLVLLMLTASLSGGLGWLAWTQQQKIALLEATVSALSDIRKEPYRPATLLEVNPELFQGIP